MEDWLLKKCNLVIARVTLLLTLGNSNHSKSSCNILSTVELQDFKIFEGNEIIVCQPNFNHFNHYA